MKLNKIILNNIFSFYEKEIIYFDNLTFIIAQNGLGKTSILNAIKLCLGYSNIDISSIFNNNSKSEICNISIDFDEFFISRTWDINTQNETFQIKFGENEYITDIEANDFIKEKIPFFLVDLLFYDGEINSNILLLSNTKLKHLFEYIFDLDLLENMNKDSLKASKVLLLDDENKDISKKYNLLQEKINTNENKIAILKDSKLSIETNVNLIQKDIKKLDMQIRQENKKLDILKQDLDKYYENLNEKTLLFKKAVFFEIPLLLNKNLKKKINAKNKPILEVKNQNELDKKIDIFSKELGLENDKIKELFNATFLNNSFDIQLSFTSNSFKKLLIEIKNIQNIIDKLKRNISNIEKNELANEKFQIIQKNLVAKNTELINLEDELSNVNETINNITETTKILEKELTKLYKTKQNNFATIQSYENLISVSNIANEIYKKELELKLSQFNNALDKSTIEFRKIYSQINKIYITNYLGLEIIDSNNKKLNIELLSAGQKQVLNFLIIKTILEFKNFSNFVMVDTPFGRLSNKNRDLIFNNCYSKFNQLSLLLTDSEFDFLKLKNLIFKRYEIYKNNLGSKIKEIKQ